MSAEYCLEFYDSGATFGPNVKQGELWSARNVGWSRYDRIPGKAFCTMTQGDPLLPLLVPLTTHVRMTRVAPAGNTEVYNGALIDYDAAGDDVVCEFYDYGSLLSISRAGYRVMYPTKALGTEIVSPEWTLAKNATSSPLGFVATGTIEDPLGTDDATVIKTNAQFGLLDQMRLQLFYDLSEMGRANTIHHVTYEITRTAPFTFHFRKNQGASSGIGLVLNGTVSDYRHLPNWRKYRNDLATLGTTVGGGATEIVKTDPAQAAAKGLRQDVFTIKTLLGIAGAATEADQQSQAADRMLKSMTVAQPAIALRLIRGFLAPFEAHDIADLATVEISNGIDSITTPWRILGERALFTEAGEDLQIIVQPVLV